MSEPVSHILRTPLPWRDSEHTECGRLAVEFVKVVTRDEAMKQNKAMGMQRFALFFCMSCISTANRWPSWEDDPVERYGREGHHQTRDLAIRELRSIAVLIAAHRAEFDDLMTGLGETTDLEQVRRDRAAERRYR